MDSDKAKKIILLGLILCIFTACWKIDTVALALRNSRVELASMIPDYTNAVTDIRITAVLRTEDLKSEVEFLDKKCLYQICYGYQLDGVWYDYPCENYNLQGLLWNKNKKGFEAAGWSHIVKIGKYLLIAINNSSSGNLSQCELFDSLDSPSLCLFTEKAGDGRYGYVKEFLISGSKEYDYQAYSNLDEWYYLIVNSEYITEDYFFAFTKNGSDSKTWVVTYNQIQQVVDLSE